MPGPETPRRFARLRPGPAPDGDYAEVPKDGMCLSAFLLVHPTIDRSAVVLGRVDPNADWWHLGALRAERLRRVAEDWMLPSSHLLEYESPEAAARRIATEQLELPPILIEGPEVHSEAYGRSGAADGDQHWDLHFLYRAEWPTGRELGARPFRELRAFRPDELPGIRLARGGADILALARTHPA